MASAGRVLVLNKGEWISDHAYSPMDEVLYDGSSYICKAAVLSTNTPDTDSTHWQLHARGFNDDQVSEFNRKADWILDHGVIIDEDSERLVGDTFQTNADLLGGEITKENVKAKVDKSDVLTLEEIKASTDVTGKVAAASSVKEISDQLDKNFVKRFEPENNSSYVADRCYIGVNGSLCTVLFNFVNRTAITSSSGLVIIPNLKTLIDRDVISALTLTTGISLNGTLFKITQNNNEVKLERATADISAGNNLYGTISFFVN